MKAFFSHDQLLHTPQQYMRLGRIHKPADLPARAQALMAALQAQGIAITPTPDLGVDVLEQAHSRHYIDFLSTAYARWQEMARQSTIEPGPEVLPNLSPYYSTVPGRPRPPCPSAGLIAQVGYYLGDLSSPLGPGSWHSILRSAHSAVAAAQAVCSGESALAYALCRPSGHHAHVDRASGFCFINNSALAAQTLQAQFGKVAVLDVDAHHGDGTQNIFYHRSDVLTISTHADPHQYFPFYTGHRHETGVDAGSGFNLNIPLAHGSGDAEFAQALRQAIDAIEAFQPGALVLAMGFDTYKDDPISVLKLDMPSYRLTGELVARLQLPTVVVQEGGYMVDALQPGLTALLEGLAAHP